MAYLSTTSTKNFPNRLTEAELARHWRVSTRTLQRWREAGTGPAWLRIGGRILYARSDILGFEEARRTIGAQS